MHADDEGPVYLANLGGGGLSSGLLSDDKMIIKKKLTNL